MKDRQKQRKYQREWLARKRAGLPTRTTPIPTEGEKYQKKCIREKRYRTNRKNKRQTQLQNKFGSVCKICQGNYHLQIHRKDGKEHIVWKDMNNKAFDELINSNDYEQLCYDCHKAVHWCMKYLHMVWEEINRYLNN